MSQAESTEPGRDAACHISQSNKSLEAWRAEIDSLDSELLRLLNQRAAIARRIGAVKVGCGLPAYDGARESKVLARLRARNPGPFDAESVSRIFRRIICETRKMGKQAMKEQQSIKSAPIAAGKGARQW